MILTNSRDNITKYSALTFRHLSHFVLRHCTLTASFPHSSSNMGLFDKVNSDVQAARSNGSCSTTPADHHSAQSSQGALGILATAAQITPQGWTPRSSSPQMCELVTHSYTISSSNSLNRQDVSPRDSESRIALFDMSGSSSPSSSNANFPHTGLRRARADDDEDDASELRARKCCSRIIEDFTADLCTKYEVPAGERAKMLQYSQVS